MSIIDYRPKARLKRVKKTLRTETKYVVKALMITLSIMIVILGITFLVITNVSAQKGYALEQAKLENKHLKNINTTLQTQVTNSTSFQNIEENQKIEDMQETEKKIYVTDEDNRVE